MNGNILGGVGGLLSLPLTLRGKMKHAGPLAEAAFPIATSSGIQPRIGTLSGGVGGGLGGGLAGALPGFLAGSLMGVVASGPYGPLMIPAGMAVGTLGGAALGGAGGGILGARVGTRLGKIPRKTIKLATGLLGHGGGPLTAGMGAGFSTGNIGPGKLLGGLL
jgi:hypothetical protein